MMRLQLSIQRHALPTVRILFTTGSGPNSQTSLSTSTIADLLSDVNLIIPLESSDGEWGLEDYVVEVACTADQDQSYECLHFTAVEHVLRDDDEVVIRALRNTELRERRMGGRHQVSIDGRHLVDGVSWGKQFTGRATRPGITIPPRKKRRLLVDAQDEINAEVGQLELVDEDDPDFTTGEEGQLQIMARGEFEDTDQEDEEDENDTDDCDDEEDGDESVAESELSDELRGLLEDAEEIMQENAEIFAEATSTQHTKRKRDVEDDGEELSDESEFEGFSTPRHHGGTPLEDNAGFGAAPESNFSDSDSGDENLLESIVAHEDKKKRNQLSDGENSSFGSFDKDSDLTSSSNSENNVVLEAVTNCWTAKKTMSDSEDEAPSSSLDGLSSGGDSGSSKDDTSSPSLSASEDGTSSSGSDVDSDSDSDSENSSTSSSSSDSSEEESDVEVKLPRPASKLLQPFKQPSVAPSSSNWVQVAPGQGSSITHQNNIRIRKRKRLVRLKSEGVLPADANFAALDAYDKAHSASKAQNTVEAGGELEINITEKKAELLEQLRSSPQIEEAMVIDESAKQEQPVPFIGAVRQNQEANKEDIDDSIEPPPNVLPPSTTALESTVESPKKRARLDIDSSRRLLFGSLGLRNPKTPAAERALREKFAKSGRPENVSTANKENESPTSSERPKESTTADDSWKSKVVISAVECEVKGLKLKPPPFPFEQGWDKDAKSRMNREKARLDRQYYQSYQQDGDEKHAADVSLPGKLVNGVETPTIESRTVSAENVALDEMPIPTDFDKLATLEADEMRPGAVIAFKELHITPSGQPEISDFRVARLVTVNEDGNLNLVLSQRDQQAAKRAKYDEATGERIYSRFEVPVDDGEEDEGSGERIKPLEELLEAKLVEASTVQVPASSINGSQATHNEEISLPHAQGSAIIPESCHSEPNTAMTSVAITETAVTEVKVSTPLRNEITTITREAGVDSAIEENLLHPDLNLRGGRLSSPELGSSQRRSAHSSRQQSVDPTEKINKASFPTSGFESAKFGEWSSSPPQEDDDSFMNDADNGEEWQTTQESRDDNEITSKSKTATMVDEIAYPHVSQLDLESSLVSQVNSSSHQDAQKVDQIEVDETEVDITRLVDEPDSKERGQHDESEVEDMNEQLDSLKSTIPSSEAGLPPQRQSSPVADTFLGGQRDGHDSLRDDDDSDIDGLPSLRSLTWSQPPQSSTAAETSRVSRPLLKKGGLRSGKIRQSSKSPDSSQDSRAPMIKVSASQQQRSGRSMTQIPEGSQVVDLTLISDPVSPGGSDGKVTFRDKATLRKQPEKTEGLGKRRLLISRKARSQI